MAEPMETPAAERKSTTVGPIKTKDAGNSKEHSNS